MRLRTTETGYVPVKMEGRVEVSRAGCNRPHPTIPATSPLLFRAFQRAGGAQWKGADGRNPPAHGAPPSDIPGEGRAAGMSQGREAWQARGLPAQVPAPCQADSAQVRQRGGGGRAI